MLADECRISLLPGMTAGYPIYSRLVPLLNNAKLEHFIPPLPGETLKSYAIRMAPKFEESHFIAGVSFGSMLALEISRLVKPMGCIVIAGIQGPQQLPPWFRIGRWIGGRRCSRLLNLIGRMSERVPRRLQSSETMRMTKLAGPEGHWHRWATCAILDWQVTNSVTDFRILHIHGDSDATFPLRYVRPDVVIEGGLHGLPISHPRLTAAAINDFVTSTCESSSTPSR